jgi:hypothetical protein
VITTVSALRGIQYVAGRSFPKHQLIVRDLRQVTVTDLGHEEPTLLLTNNDAITCVALVTRYAQRMLIENGIAAAIQGAMLNALNGVAGPMSSIFGYAFVGGTSGNGLGNIRAGGYQDSNGNITYPFSRDLSFGAIRSHNRVRAERQLLLIYLNLVADTGLLNEAKAAAC